MIKTILFLLMMQEAEPISDLSCQLCHDPNRWYPLSESMLFDHNATQFPLEGMHHNAECIQCHSGSTTKEIHAFNNADPDCATCHMDIHFTTYGSDCRRCHNEFSWDFLNWKFKHDETLFPLVGAHAVASCESCHGNINQQLTILNTSTECIECHRTQFEREILASNHSENEACYLCHNTHAWLPTDMSHHDFYFPIFSGSHKNEWSTCEAECHVNPTDYSDFSCGLNGVCHEHRQSEMDDEHDDEQGYSYVSSACYDCHPSGKGD